mmetsp:Transcript_51092/g.111368  ORF Transcript_51092/g.111368 Transcript_51092/m.111368 type:complete len:202 (+) Transcript_51092:182-787(+)
MSQSGGRWSRQKPALPSPCAEPSPGGRTRPAPEAAPSARRPSPPRRSSWPECPPRRSDPRPIHHIQSTAAARSSSGIGPGRIAPRRGPLATLTLRGERMGGAGCPCDPPVHGLAGSASRSKPAEGLCQIGRFRRWTRCRRTRCASFCHPVRIDHVGGLGSPHSNCRRSGWRARTGSSSLQTRRPGRFLQKMGDWDWLSLPD